MTTQETSVFYMACCNGDLDAVKKMLANSESNDINRVEPDGNTALHAAAYYGHANIVRLLLEQGASTNIRNRYNNTAKEDSKTDEVRAMFESKMKVDGAANKNDDDDGKSPSASVQIYRNPEVKIKCIRNATTIAGGNGCGQKLYQLGSPEGIFVDDDQTIYIADWENHRIVQWKSGAKEGKIIAGGNGTGNRIDQLTFPTDVCIDKQNNSLIIADWKNRRVIQCSIENPTDKQIVIENIDCWGVTTDKDGSIYVSDWVKNEVKRWKKGEKEGTVVAGRNQLRSPTYLFVDKDYSIYVSDSWNHRVMKWKKDCEAGIVVAGGNGVGNQLNQLSFPQGVVADHLGHIYVADPAYDRVMRWCEGCKEGEIVVGGNGKGDQSNKLSEPRGLSFDAEGNLYVADAQNNRIQKFKIDSNGFKTQSPKLTKVLSQQSSVSSQEHSLSSLMSNKVSINSSSVLATSSPVTACQHENKPVMYIIGFELPSLNLHPDTTQVIVCMTDMLFVNDIYELNPQYPFYILSSESVPSHLMSNSSLIHYYYVSTSMPHAETNDRLTIINPIERFSSELYTDLSKYYRDKAYQLLSEGHDRGEVKFLLEKSKKCLELLRYTISQLGVTPMQVQNPSEDPQKL